MHKTSVLLLFLFTISLVTPICAQLFFDASEISSFVKMDEESKIDTSELEAEKFTEELIVYESTLKFQKTPNSYAVNWGFSFWKTVYEEPAAPPPKQV